MKITVEHIDSDEKEVVLRCRELDDEMLRILSLLRSSVQKLLVWDEERHTLPLNVSEVVYCETVEDRNFVYTAGGIF